MPATRKIALLASALLVVGAAKPGRDGFAAQEPVPPTLRVGAAMPAYAPKILREPTGADKTAEARAFNDAAKTAWAFIDHGYSAKTGFVVANPEWPYPTVWDIASSIASYYSARGLGLITEEDYRRRVSKALETLNVARLYNGVAFGRNYDANTGELVGLDQKPSPTGTGYSSIDIGRLLIWLKILSADPQLAPMAKQVASRLNGNALIRNGYLLGEQITKDQPLSKYQEGRLGYEQYAARGFELWGWKPSRALSTSMNARRVMVKGIPVMADRRGLDRLTSEPFLVHGLELGLTGGMNDMAWQTLSLQARRYEETQLMTMASEDALNDAPWYFYYYCVYCSGKAFVINVHKPGVELDAPRWISTKAAFGWHALMPSKYTWLAIASVQPASQGGRGWDTGVYEKTGKTTGVMSLNTAAVVLESALYYKTGKPMLTP